MGYTCGSPTGNLKNIYLYIYFAAPGLSCGIRTLSCSMWILVPCPGIKPRPSALEEQSLNHRTTTEVLRLSVPINEMGFAAASLTGIFNALRTIFFRGGGAVTAL